MFSFPGRIGCANEFAFGMMWGAHGNRNLSVLDPDDVLLAVRKAYIDMTPRTIDGLGLSFLDKLPKEYAKEKISILTTKKTEIDQLKKWLAEKLVGVFRRGSFSHKDHDELCNDFIGKFKTHADKINTELGRLFPASMYTPINTKKITFGKAQKIVNMSFKYLYLFNDAFDARGNCKYNNIFDNCDMAIDANILQYFIDNDPGNKKTYTKTTWSNMNDTDYDIVRGLIDTYCASHSSAIASGYATKFPACPPPASGAYLSKPFYAEFYIFDMTVN